MSVANKFYDFYFSLSYLKKEVSSKEFGMFEYYDSVNDDRIILVKINGRFIPFCEQISCGRVPLIAKNRSDLIYLGAFNEDEVEYEFISVEEFKHTFDLKELYEFCLSLNANVD